MVKWTGKRIIKLSLYKEMNTAIFGNVGYEHVFFWILYILSLYYCYITIGDQYLEALTRAEEQNIDVFDDSEKLRNSALNFLGGDAGDTEAKVPTFRVPSKWLPGFWASILFGLVVILHILMVLGQKWSVWFRCLIRFRRVSLVSEATHAHITPQKHQGKDELVEIQRIGNSLFVEFHRRQYVYDSAQDSFVKVRCRVNYPVSHYLRWRGIPTEEVCSTLMNLHGPNKFQMSSPAFMDVYLAQLTSPFTVFQIFCIVLWMLDDYWQYSLFTLFMICSFEATTVFSRLKSLSTLKGMGNEPRSIYVYRLGVWKTVSTEDLLPGDIFSLTKHKDNVIPCDAMILRGGAVVNEASLTGESVPQMKDGLFPTIDESGLQAEVNIKGAHKVHALFGGTRVLQVSSVSAKSAEFEEDLADEKEVEAEEERGRKVSTESCEHEDVQDEGVEATPLEGSGEGDGAEDGGGSDMESPPDGGCLCYCTRTGFSSSQGKLVRMIEHSQTSVGGDTRDTALLLLFLLIFALSASGYVLIHGMRDGSRSKYQLLLHCILIITSVIPPELPMQTALAVNASLMTLMKMQIFCTEPFRVPIAGKVDTCVFDKTGTLTTDELVAVGVVSPAMTSKELRREHDLAIAKLEKLSEEKQKAARHVASSGPPPKNGVGVNGAAAATKEESSLSSAATAGMTPIREASPEMMLVLGACHSVVLVDGKPAGDPLEVASLRAIRWEMSPKVSDTARPKPELAVERPLKVSTLDSGDVPLSQVKILARHHFNSKLQRMSVVARVKGDSGGAWSVVKGSPEALRSMCVDCSADYMQVAGDLAKRGMRVIALGLRRLTGPDEIQACCESRLACENSLRFAGFVAFTCRVRKDSATCVQNLRAGGNAVIMATGDAMLTAVHVAQEVGITTTSKKGVLILENGDGDAQADVLRWMDYGSGEDSGIPFIVDGVSTLAADYDLCVTGFSLTKALDLHPTLSKQLEKFVVYARMRPDEKERVILAMKNNGRVCLMCGDGANVSSFHDDSFDIVTCIMNRT